eukprot:5901099-Amphidinium_carterae.2
MVAEHDRLRDPAKRGFVQHSDERMFQVGQAGPLREMVRACNEFDWISSVSSHDCGVPLDAT